MRTKVLCFSDKVNCFRGKYLPESNLQLAGYTALIKAFSLPVPLPDIIAVIGNKDKRYLLDCWCVYSCKTNLENNWYAHVKFALKHEGVNLAVLKALFQVIPENEIIEIIQAEPSGSYSRRIWFLYEWLLDITLPIPDAAKQNLVDVIDEKLQYPGPAKPSARHKVRNNLPGVPGFCPLIRRTELLDNFIQANLDEKILNYFGNVHADIVMRASAFLLLQDSKASYAIEGESPPHNRAERWGQAIGQAGLHSLSQQEFYRLQEIVVSDFRFTHYGYRVEGGFIGVHDRVNKLPVPDHISARWQDIPELMKSLIATNELLKTEEIHPVLAATIIAFGFVFIHPFEDGNGRIHRYLLHHVLAERNFAPKGTVFPISAVILNRIDEYRKILEEYSKPRQEFIKWRPTAKNNLEVLNETIDLYRYFDATKQAEFLFSCIEETIIKILPAEINYLQRHDQLRSFINNYIEIPDRLVELMINFLRQNNGKFSDRARKKEFANLTLEEIVTIEAKYNEIFG